MLTNGVNVGGRAGTSAAPGALAAGALTLDVQAGQGLRLRLGNETVVRFFRLILTDNTGVQIPLIRVGGQGGILDEALVEGGGGGGFDFDYGSGEILFDPGDRQDVAVAIPPTATGVLTLWTQDFDRTGAGFANIPTVPVAHFKVTGTASTYTIGAGTDLLTSLGQAVETLGPATGTLLDPTTFSPPKPELASQDIQLIQTGSSLGINGLLGSHHFPGDFKDFPHAASARYAQLGETLELTVTNATDAHAGGRKDQVSFSLEINSRVTCNGRPATIVGNSKASTIFGTPDNHVIHGRGGNDIIHGLGGNDVICGGAGDDRLFANQGKDQLFGESENDALKGGIGNDRLFGQAGNDAMDVGLGNDDNCNGGPGTDTAASCEQPSGVP